jgi:hypothetical protein
MGAHGIGLFDDDNGADFAAEILKSDSFNIADNALRGIPEEDFEYVEHPEGMRALLAAELVASQMGYPSDDLSDELQMWAEQFGEPDRETKNLARSAVARILRKSETRDLWKDSELFADWLSKTRDLASRLE